MHTNRPQIVDEVKGVLLNEDESHKHNRNSKVSRNTN